MRTDRPEDICNKQQNTVTSTTTRKRSRLYFRLQQPSQSRVHTTLTKKNKKLFRTSGTSKRGKSLQSQHRYFHDDNTFPIGKVNINSENKLLFAAH